MKKLLLLLLLLLPLHTSYSQRLNSTNAVIVSATDPTGNACSSASPNLTYGTGNTRNLYTCQGGVYAISTGSGAVADATITSDGKQRLGEVTYVASSGAKPTCNASSVNTVITKGYGNRSNETCKMMPDGSTYAWVDDNPVCDITRFGATDNGITDDDTAAVAAAAVACAGKKVFIPDGSFRVSQVTFTSNTTVTGNGPASIIIPYSTTVSTFVTSGATKVRFENFAMTQALTGATATVGAIAFTNTSTFCEVDKVNFTGMSSSGVLIYDSNNCTVSRCTFAGWSGTVFDSADVNIYNQSSDNLVTDCDLNGGGYHGALIQDPYTSATPTGNRISGNRVGAHTAYGIAVYMTTNFNTKTVIDRNRVSGILGTALSGTSGAGIYVQSSAGTLVTGNHVSQTCLSTSDFGTLAPAGIGVTSTLAGVPVILSNNTIDNITKGPGVFINTSPTPVSLIGNTVIVANTGASTNGLGIYLKDALDVTSIGNKVTQNYSGYTAYNIATTNVADIAFSSTGDEISSVAGGLAFNSISGGTFAKSKISGVKISSTQTGLFVSASSDLEIDTAQVTAASTVALYLNGGVRTRITNSKFYSASGVLFASTNTGSFMDRSSYFNGPMDNRASSGVIVEQFGTAAPVSGTWAVGDTIINSVPAIGSAKSWHCTANGTPGTWAAAYADNQPVATTSSPTFGTVTLSSLTNTRIPFLSGGALADSASLTWSGSTFTALGNGAFGTQASTDPFSRSYGASTLTLTSTAGTPAIVVSGSAASRLEMGYGSTFASNLYTDSTGMQIGAQGSRGLFFATNGLVRATITSGGLFALGTGTTSSFPALKRNGTGVDFRLADDSGDAPISALNVTITNTGTATASAGAATLNTQTGTITSEALTTAAGSTYALTITNSKVTTSSIVTASVQNGTNSVDNYYVQRITPGSGSVTIVIYNASGGALNGTIKVSFIVM